MKLSKEYEQRLADMYGRLPNGKPKLRVVTPEEAKRPHGILKGIPKYLNPETGKAMQCLMLEQWFPPTLVGSREEWQGELLGPYPADCACPDCDHGIWGLRSPLTTPNEEFLPMSEMVMDYIERKQFADVSWAMLSPAKQLEYLDAEMSAREKKADDASDDEFTAMIDHYILHREEIDGADNRVFSFGGANALTGRGNKEPIGRPQ